MFSSSARVRGADGSDQDHLLVTGTVRDGARDVAVALVTTKVRSRSSVLTLSIIAVAQLRGGSNRGLPNLT